MEEARSELVTLTTDRLVLRAPRESDVDAIFAACQDEEIQRWTVVPVPYRREDAEFFVRTLAPEGRAAGAEFIWCVVERGTGRLVGAQAVTRQAGDPAAGSVGWWTAKEQRGRGYTVEAARAVARWALTDLGLRRLQWLAYVGNEGSRAVAERVGYRHEGTLRSYADQRGVFRDAWIASLLPADLD
ncbi:MULTISPECIES: GNAT family N-acetyltransferase [Kitasatospora]|uniref:GNAT family N-acetyltransferase n=1 Tax=Kitasatospora cathayae TaxID=3004092 RepID=A0ABY7Q795_9ACTN|nr:GNAT family N-acetyltransferase [Kitasatospora sp. HUAS 3-15]WBP88603.1 GNAT family N-acetyltransferase [Kitasatospora sp. HUAS 3-15]